MPNDCHDCAASSRNNGNGEHRDAAKPSHDQAHDVVAAAWSSSWRKTLFDRVAATIVFIVLSPVMLLLWVLVRVTSTGPAVFRQRRVGHGGRNFTLYKLRTMRIDAEARTGAVWAQQHDPRCTPLGRVMRHLHLDELPQLVNVIKGDMALVGPRPERPEFVVQLEAKIPGYVERHMGRPGITGLAQILLPPDQEVDDVRRKLVVDLHYVAHCGFWLDFRLLVFTGLRLLRFPVAACNFLAPLPSLAAIPGLPPLPEPAPAHRTAPVATSPPPVVVRAKPDSRTALPVASPMLARSDVTPISQQSSLPSPETSL